MEESDLSLNISVKDGVPSTVVTPSPGKKGNRRKAKTKVEDNVANDGLMIQAAKKGITSFGVQYTELPPRKMSDGRHLLTFCANSFCTLNDAVIAIWEKEERVAFYLRAPALVPEHLHTQVILFLNRVNNGLCGKFADPRALGMMPTLAF